MDYLTDARNEVQSYFATHHIPTYFYQCLFGELVKIWGAKFISPCNTEGLYQDQISEYLVMTSGTGGWNVAFNEACAQCDLMDVNEYYINLDWIKSDIFDDIISDNMVKILFSENVGHDYYHYMFRKNNK